MKKLYNPTFVADMHNDLPVHVKRFREQGEHQVIERKYLKDMEDGGVKVIVCAIFLSDACSDDWFGNAMAQIHAMHEDIQESSDKLMLCTCYKDAVSAVQEGKTAFFLSLEGGEPIRSEDDLEFFYRQGVRFLGVTWKRKNMLSDGCSFLPIDQWEEKTSGLTEFGKRIIIRAKELGMIVDLSHISEQGFWDVLELTDGPVYASHSNLQGVNGIRRNLSNEQLKAIAERKSLTGMNGVERHVMRNYTGELAEPFVAHINYVSSLVGSRHVGLGLDLFTYYQDEKEGKPRDTFESYGKLPRLTELLHANGYSEQEIEAIMNGNFMNFIRENLN